MRCLQGNCSEAPPPALLPGRGETPLLPLRQRQCLIRLNTGLLEAEARLWLDGVYLRIDREGDGNAYIVAASSGSAVPPAALGLWMTAVTIQGDAGPRFPPERGLMWGVQVIESDFLAEGAPCIRMHALVSRDGSPSGAVHKCTQPWL